MQEAPVSGGVDVADAAGTGVGGGKKEPALVRRIDERWESEGGEG